MAGGHEQLAAIIEEEIQQGDAVLKIMETCKHASAHRTVECDTSSGFKKARFALLLNSRLLDC
jgi:hypothetical protein